MSDSFVRLPVDGSGKLLDTSQVTVGANTVQRERHVIADNVNNNYANVSSAGGLQVDGSAVTQPTNIIQVGSAAITQGQKTMATSVPVVVASDQTALTVSQATAANLNATVTGTVSTSPPANASTNITQIGGSALSKGQTTMAGSIPVVIASDQSTVQFDPQGPDAQGAVQTGKPLQNAGRNYSDGTIRTIATDANGVQQVNITGIGGTVTVSLPPQPFLNVTDFTDVVAHTPVLGDIIAVNSTPKYQAVAGSVSLQDNFLSQVGTGSVSALPVWRTSTGNTGTPVVLQTAATLTPKYFAAAANTQGGYRFVSQYPGADISVQLQNCINDIANVAFGGNGGTCDATDMQNSGNKIFSQNVTFNTLGVHVKLPCNIIDLLEFAFIIPASSGNGTWIEGCTASGTESQSGSQISTVLLTNFSSVSGVTGKGGSCAICIGGSGGDTANIMVNNLSIDAGADSGLQPPVAPSISCSNSGGSLATGTIFVKVGLEIPAGPVANTNGMSATSAEASCSVTGPSGSVTVTAPSLAINPFACYSVYSSGTTGTEKLNATGTCITSGTYVIQTLGAGISAPSTNNAFTMPIYAQRMSRSVFRDVNITGKTATNNSGQVGFQIDAGNGQESAFNIVQGVVVSAGLIGFRCESTGTGFCAGNAYYDDWFSGPGKTVVGTIAFDFAKGDAYCLPCASDNSETGLNLSGNGGTYVYRAEPSTNTNHVRLNSGTQMNTVVVTTGGSTVVNNSGNGLNTIIQPDKMVQIPSYAGPTVTANGQIAYNSTTNKYLGGVNGATVNFVMDNIVNTASASMTLDMSAASATAGFKVPVAAGAAPTASAQIAYDSTANLYRGGVNGTNTQFGMTISSGTATFATTAIAAAACSAVVTVAGSGIATTDAVEWSYNAQPTAGTDASLIINSWPTSGNINFKRCNPTAASITPTAVVINWRVVR